VRTTLHSAHFEVYDSTLVLKLSDVLDKFEIQFQGRVSYRGRAVVRGLVESGFRLACEVKLNEESWCGLNPSSVLSRTGQPALEFKDFLNEWQKLCRVQPAFKSAAIDLLTFFADAQIWLNQLEMSLGTMPPESRERAERDMLTELKPLFIQATTGITERFEHALNQVERDLLPVHQSFVRRFLHPVTQCSPFMHRAYEKPLGYAGDFEVVDMMFRDPFQGSSFFAKLLNAYALQLPPVVAHRNRIEYLLNMLAGESLRALARGRQAQVFNLGCGPAREVQQFVAGSELSHHASFVLADFEEKSLVYTNRVLQELKQRHHRRTLVKTKRVSVAQLIKEADRRDRHGTPGEYDVVYCAGLFDYLTDTICRQLLEVFYGMLAPDGLLVATNVDVHPAINQMECFLDWHLQYRNPQAMRELVPAAARSAEVAVKCDASGANVFLEVRKPA
jgi:extracellular factor (EF) 3-hydroxypalmitic acid methyl ester biosynthesis protein